MGVDTTLPPWQVHRFSLEEYHQLIESGGFDEDARVELIEGLVADMSPKTKEHENAIRWLTRWLMLAVDLRRFEVGVQTALTLHGSEPEPDFTVVPLDAPRPYHPGTAALVVEVAVSSQDRDLRQKPQIYARAGVPEYWVVDVDAGRIVVHRDPVASCDPAACCDPAAAHDRASAGYRTILEVPATGKLQAQALALPELDAAELFAAVRR